MLKSFIQAIVAGAAIGIGGMVYLNVGGVAGAVLFAFGLLTVVHYKLGLYTGQAGFFKNDDELERLFYLILAGNVVGCYLMGFVAQPTLAEPAQALVTKVVAAGMGRNFIVAIPCGFIMTTAVYFARKGQWLPLLFGVPVFILCGFRHSIADAFYYAASGLLSRDILFNWLAVVAGNFVGCNLHRLWVKVE